MISVLLIPLVAIISFATSAEIYANSSRNLRSDYDHLQRQSRFITFQTMDDDLKLALEFAVPFITVPVKRSADEAANYAKGLGMLNVNLAALVLTGITVIAGVSTASALANLGHMVTGKKKSEQSSGIMNDISSFPLAYRTSKGEKGEAPVSEILSNVEAIFREYDIDITSCVQKTVCLLVQESINNVSQGKGSSSNKIIDGLTSTNWLLNFISGTAVKEAIDVGRSSYECKYRYSSCTWSDRDLRDFIDSM